MARELEQETQRWLAAEAAADAERAEVALRRAFHHLPQPPVPPGFTDRVMARAAEQPLKDPFATRRVRAAIAVTFLAAASLLLVVGQLLRLLATEVRPLDLLSEAAAACGRFLPAATTVTEGLVTDLATLSAVTARLLTTPVALGAVIVLTVLCAGALRLIHDLSRSRGPSNADVL